MKFIDLILPFPVRSRSILPRSYSLAADDVILYKSWKLTNKNDERCTAADYRLDRMEDTFDTLEINKSGAGLVMLDRCDQLKEEISPLENKAKVASFSNW